MENIKLTIQTHQKKQVIDITDKIQEVLDREKTGHNLISIFILHTTAAITTADLDAGTDLDFLDAVTKMLPNLQFRHPHDPSHAPDHILSSLIGPSLTIPVENNTVQLGMWQRIVLVEFDGPRERSLVMTAL